MRAALEIVLTEGDLWMVRFTGFSGSCFFSSLGLLLSRVLGLASFVVRPFLPAVTLVLLSSLALERPGFLGLGLDFFKAVSALALRLHSSLAFLAAMRRTRRFRGTRGAAGVLLRDLTPSSNLGRPGFLLGFGVFQTL